MSKPFDQVLDVDLNEIINLDGIESFSDLIESLAGAGGVLENGVLGGLSFQPVGITAEGLIQIRVQAEIEEY